jgi:hypothetical protein
MIPKKIAAQATALSLIVVAVSAFLLHAPCRNSSYSDGVFNTLCYSDFAPVFADEIASDWNNFAPLPALVGRAIASVDLPWLYQLVIWQVGLISLLAITAISIFRSPMYPKFSASYLLLMPALPFLVFVSDSVFAITFATLSLLAWQSGAFNRAGVFAGLALASGVWTWVLLLSYFVIARRFEALSIFRKTTGIAILIAGLISSTRLLFGAPLLVPINFTAGEGTPLFVTDLVQNIDFTSNLIPVLIGIAITLGLAQYLDFLPLDFRLEPVVAMFVAIQLLTSIAISPQHLLHLVWILPLWLSNYRFLFFSSLPLILYTAAVWFRFENNLEGGVGLPDVPYALIAFGFWVYLLWIIRRAFKSITTPGVDRHDQIPVD